MKSLAQFFSYMNDINFPYVVLRNFENLPDQIKVDKHNDLDLLVYDLKHFKEIFPGAIEVFPFPRVMYKMEIGGENVCMDVRFVGDGYYPTQFELNILETREFNERGFYTPNPIHFRLALAYHAVHHKGENTYPNHLGDATVLDKFGVDDQLFNSFESAKAYAEKNEGNVDKREGLLSALQRSTIGYVIPSDPSVGRFNQYWRGATSIVTKEDGKILKKQEAWNEYDLIGNEYRILSQLNSRHFPKATKTEEGVELEDCGDRLNVYNLPENWKQQLIEILYELKSNKVLHRDIKPDNLMVKNGVIKLVDFGWARFENDPQDNPPNCLGHPYRPTWGWDDGFSMKKVIKEFEFKKEEQLV